jgi:hypothetical protein
VGGLALHSSLGIAERRGLLAYLTQRGVFIDVGHDTHIPLERLQVVRDTYPRPAHDRSIRDAILEHASRSEAAAPPYSIAAELLRQKRAEGELRLGALEQPDPERARVASGSEPGWCQCSGATMSSA